MNNLMSINMKTLMRQKKNLRKYSAPKLIEKKSKESEQPEHH